MRILLVLIMVIATSSVCLGQINEVYDVDESCYSLVSVVPDSSPIELTKMKAFLLPTGDRLSTFAIKNRFNRGIIEVVIDNFDFFGGTDETGSLKSKPGTEIGPGEEIASHKVDSFNILPAASIESATKGPCRFPNFRVYVVTKVVFSDNSVWQDEQILDVVRSIQTKLGDRNLRGATDIIKVKAEFMAILTDSLRK